MTSSVSDLQSINSPWFSHSAMDTLFDDVILAVEQGKQLCIENYLVNNIKLGHMNEGSSTQFKMLVIDGLSGILLARDEDTKQYIIRTTLNGRLLVACDTSS